jgi:PHD/YefM family antitoxin component YafN of YafNO toxin-antitoxin module
MRYLASHNTARFSEFVETSTTPVTVTENGHENFFVMRVKDYDALVSDREKSELMSRIAISEHERAVRSGRDAFAELDPSGILIQTR